MVRHVLRTARINADLGRTERGGNVEPLQGTGPGLFPIRRVVFVDVAAIHGHTAHGQTGLRSGSANPFGKAEVRLGFRQMPIPRLDTVDAVLPAEFDAVEDVHVAGFEGAAKAVGHEAGLHGIGLQKESWTGIDFGF